MKKATFIKGALFISLVIVIGLPFFLKVGSRFFNTGAIKDTIASVVRYFPFSKENSLKEWEEKVLKGRVVYLIEKDGSLSYVRAKSEKTASALYHRIRLDVARRPLISWKWRVDEFPKRTSPEIIEDIEEEDFAARVYVIFPAAFFTGSKVIEYIWSETLPPDTSGVSGYSKNIRMLVIEEGKSNGEWRFEERDIYKDYVRLFGEEPKLGIGAIAFMTDADSTKTSATATYDEIKIGYNEN